MTLTDPRRLTDSEIACEALHVLENRYSTDISDDYKNIVVLNKKEALRMMELWQEIERRGSAYLFKHTGDAHDSDASTRD